MTYNHLFPCVETLVYPRGEESDEGRRWLFEQPSRPNPDGTSGVATGRVTAFADDQLHMVLDFPGLLRTLGAAAIDHPAPPANKERPPTEDGQECRELPDQLAAFLAHPDHVSMTVRIRFTDDGLAMVRLDDMRLQMMFFLRPRLEPDRETKLRALFADVGLIPREDYMADRGHTRVLAVPLPADQEAIVGLCIRVCREVYGMESDDSLEFTFRS